jgi:nitrate reductase alpha subunit
MNGMGMSGVTMALAAIAMLVGSATAATAASVDVRGERELTGYAQKIEKTAAAHYAGRMTARIVEEWKGTAFKFDADRAPRALRSQDVRDLLAQQLGYGEICIVLAVAANQPGRTAARSIDEILAMRQASGGWGKLARALGYRDLAAVNRTMRATERNMADVAAERGRKPDRSTASAEPDTMESPEVSEQPVR